MADISKIMLKTTGNFGYKASESDPLGMLEIMPVKVEIEEQNTEVFIKVEPPTMMEMEYENNMKDSIQNYENCVKADINSTIINVDDAESLRKKQTEKSLTKLMKSSYKAATDQVQHLLVVVTPDGQVQVNGSANMVRSVYENNELFQRLETCLLDNIQEGGTITPVQVFSYPLLPCSPFSPSWKGSGMIRGVLTKMLVRAGYGRCGRSKRLGMGDPPAGWPDNISWRNYAGATKSKLTSSEVTAIIVSLLRAANIDPDNHVRPTSIGIDNNEETDKNALEQL